MKLPPNKYSDISVNLAPRLLNLQSDERDNVIQNKIKFQKNMKTHFFNLNNMYLLKYLCKMLGSLTFAPKLYRIPLFYKVGVGLGLALSIFEFEFVNKDFR